MIRIGCIGLISSDNNGLKQLYNTYNMEYVITHQPEQNLFKTEVDGRTAFVQYRLLGDYLDIIHTIVPPPIEGRGIAAALVKAAYDYALANGMKPKATCSYAVRWLERHPELNENT